MKEAGKGGVADARELKPMVGGDEEVAVLHEFPFHFFSLSVFTDCTSSGEAFVICITQDMLLFLFVCLPITWMAELLSQLRLPSVKVSWKEQRHLCRAQRAGVLACLPVRTISLVFWLSGFSFHPTGHLAVCLKQQFILTILEDNHEGSFQLAEVHIPPFEKKNCSVFIAVFTPLRTFSSVAQIVLSLLLLFLFVFYLVWFCVIFTCKQGNFHRYTRSIW